jgi:hypothetical protein
MFAEEWRRTVDGVANAAMPGAPEIAWMSTAGTSGEPWPRCWWTTATQWECIGVPVDATGVAIAVASGVHAAVVAPGTIPVLRASRWGRLVVTSMVPGGPPAQLTISAARAVSSPGTRVRGVRLQTSTVADVRVEVIGSGVAWVSGDSSPVDAWLELRAARAGPMYLPLSEIAETSPFSPLRIFLSERRTMDAVVVWGAGEAATGALLTLYRLIDAPPRDSRDPPPRRVFVAEAVADADGKAKLEGLGEADYEVVAWHPQLGRASTMLPAGRDTVTIRLQSPGVVRGRVLAGGHPAAGIEVVSVPDTAAYAAAVDPLDLKGGDARTGSDGRFTVSVSPGGGGELRFGGGAHAVTRVPLPRTPLPIVELGDIELTPAVALTVALDQDSPCDLHAAGPIGRAGLQIVKGTRTGPGLFAITMPEEGAWEFVLVCGRVEQALSPSIVSVSARDAGRQIRLLVR